MEDVMLEYCLCFVGRIMLVMEIDFFFWVMVRVSGLGEVWIYSMESSKFN